MSKSKRWCFTINHPENEPRPTQRVNYMVWEYEKGEMMGTLHIQGYVRFSARLMMNQVKKELQIPTAHLVVARGTETQNRDYCTKEPAEGTVPTIIGTFDPGPTQGRRTDLEAVSAAVLSGRTLRATALEYPAQYIKYHQGIRALHQLVTPQPPELRNVSVVVLWGQTDTGKSHRVTLQYNARYVVTAGRGPFDMYDNEKVLVFEEFNPSDWPIRKMNMLLDKYKLRLDCRYFDKWARWELVIIISNQHPDHWYMMESPPVLAAFKRRLTRIIEVHHKYEDIDLPPDPELASDPSPPLPEDEDTEDETQ